MVGKDGKESSIGHNHGKAKNLFRLGVKTSWTPGIVAAHQTRLITLIAPFAMYLAIKASAASTLHGALQQKEHLHLANLKCAPLFTSTTALPLAPVLTHSLRPCT